MSDTSVAIQEQNIAFRSGHVELSGSLALPGSTEGVVLFAHGSGSSRHSPRNQFVARKLQEAGVGTVLIDLLTEDEEQAERFTRHLRFDIGMLADRLVWAIDWLAGQPQTRDLKVGLFGASTGGGAALVAAARQPGKVMAVVSRGGRPDLAGEALASAKCPTLLIVGGNDDVVIELNEQAIEKIAAPVKELVIVPGASHLFEEPGALEEVARLAADWFSKHLRATVATYAG
ncbi:MAG: dienelactone hydrolase family protein [Gemmataceae bacterium]